MYSRERNISHNGTIEYGVKACTPTSNRSHIVWSYSCTREGVSIYVQYSGNIFDTELSVAAATDIQWRLPGLGSRVAVACSVNSGGAIARAGFRKFGSGGRAMTVSAWLWFLG